MIKPDYHGGSIVNLMSSVLQATSCKKSLYPPLRDLNINALAVTQNVVLFVIDGLGYHYLTTAGKNSVLHRHLRHRITSVSPSTTAAAITTFMTGLAPQQHGLTGWYTYFKEIDRIVTVLPFKPRFNANLHQPLNVDIKTLYGLTPVFDLMDIQSYVVSPDAIAHSEFNLTHSGKAQINAYSSLEHCFETVATLITDNIQRKYIYAYWPLLDSYAHDKGMASDEVAQHFHAIDNAFAQLLSQTKGTNTIILVTADHGIIDSSPDQCIDINQYPELSDMLAMPLCGERRMAYCYLKPQAHQAFTHYIKTTFRDQIALFNSQEMIAQNYFGLGSPHPQLNHRVGDFILATKSNLTIMDTIAGEHRFVHIGNHGGFSPHEMYVPLIIANQHK